MIPPRQLYSGIVLGGCAVAVMAIAGGSVIAPAFAGNLERKAREAIQAQGGAPIVAHFRSQGGWPSRHPLLTGGETLDDGARTNVAKAVAAIPGVSGIVWSDGSIFAHDERAAVRPLDCQKDVEALLRSRSIRFEESSARMDAASGALVDEVASAMRPCLGSIIAISGHTDSSGTEAANAELSLARAQAVRDALVERDIPADGLRVRGLGSRQPVAGLEPGDPANRRIEFSVVAIAPVAPTPVDTPGPR